MQQHAINVQWKFRVLILLLLKSWRTFRQSITYVKLYWIEILGFSTVFLTPGKTVEKKEKFTQQTTILYMRFPMCRVAGWTFWTHLSVPYNIPGKKKTKKYMIVKPENTLFNLKTISFLLPTLLKITQKLISAQTIILS